MNANDIARWSYQHADTILAVLGMVCSVVIASSVGGLVAGVTVAIFVGLYSFLIANLSHHDPTFGPQQ